LKIPLQIATLASPIWKNQNSRSQTWLIRAAILLVKHEIRNSKHETNIKLEYSIYNHLYFLKWNIGVCLEFRYSDFVFTTRNMSSEELKELDFVTAQEVSDWFRVPLSSVYHLVKTGRLRAVHIGKHVRIMREDVEKLLSPVKGDSHLLGGSNA